MTDEELLAKTDRAEMSRAEWTHEAHVRMAWLLIRRLGMPAAIHETRRRIQGINRALEVPEGPTQGYNETTTVAMLHLIAAVDRHYDAAFAAQDSKAFYDTHRELHTDKVLRFFYSPERRMDPRAKSEYLPPDLTPFPD